MAQGEGFKHITVTAADDDDVVIHAGIVKDEPTEIADEAGEEPLVVGGGPELEPEPARPAKPAKPAKPRDSYRETTLEDLQPTPMPLAQKIVIIAAVVCIIGAIVYWIAFMG